MHNTALKKPVKNNHCKWCHKDIPTDKPYVVFPDITRSCLPCYHSSGASLKMFRK